MRSRAGQTSSRRRARHAAVSSRSDRVIASESERTSPRESKSRVNHHGMVMLLLEFRRGPLFPFVCAARGSLLAVPFDLLLLQPAIRHLRIGYRMLRYDETKPLVGFERAAFGTNPPAYSFPCSMLRIISRPVKRVVSQRVPTSKVELSPSAYPKKSMGGMRPVRQAEVGSA